ncbi:MAG: PA2169 family four-helix-bundle protein [Ferruginibacter sp.]|nr:PA2169 family four-helix-bundle protein [Chitinophagaceae bacterium]
MKNINQNTSGSIYNLIAVLEDAKNGYLHASEKIKDSVLSLLLERFGYQRGRYSSELRILVSSMGTDSLVDQFTLSMLQRTWLDLKSTFKYGKKEQIIEGCIKAEETALKNYSHAIDQLEDNYEVRMVLLQQANGIRTVLNTIKEYTGRMYN